MKKFLMVSILALLFCSVEKINAQTNPCLNAQVYNSVSITTSGSTQLIAAPANAQFPYWSIRICAYTIAITETATPATWGLTYGTGTNCGTGNAKVTPQWPGVASAFLSDGRVYGGGSTGPILSLPAGTALCLTLGGAVTSATVQVLYVIN